MSASTVWTVRRATRTARDLTHATPEEPQEMKNWKLKLIGAPLAIGSSLIVSLSPSTATEKEEKATEMTDIQGIDELKAVFAADAGSPRLVLLLSPT